MNGVKHPRTNTYYYPLTLPKNVDREVREQYERRDYSIQTLPLRNHATIRQIGKQLKDSDQLSRKERAMLERENGKSTVR